MDKTSEIIRKKEGFEGQRTCIMPKANRGFCAKNPLCKNLYITDIGLYPNAANHTRTRRKGCQQYILIYCTKGEGWYVLDNKRHKVRANQFFILPPGVQHEYGADENAPWTIYWLHFTGELAPHYYRYLLGNNTQDPVNIVPSTFRIGIFDDILQHLELMNDKESLIYGNSALGGFLVSLKQNLIRNSTSGNEALQKVIDLMRNNLHRNFTLEELSTAVNLSSSHLSSIFKQKTKYSPLNLFTSMKIQKACLMLNDSGKNIKSIAAMLGYDDPYHFSRVFKKMMGVSPKQFRNQ